ncbi:hypothetical protein KOR34_39420 [Posidoniimonas corsicana]|uniref:Autotransporter-associated beta strand repeat protein n=1 Tax=Posidoniimonas corsicana TaxID=1938618 RepID=A0A5C5V1B1_9BACT|nr:hypothetical protein [Posidoniimonas corsicana]TWT32181.1 hypothetical protein KOR34_39420 [Posidoniimonas corsicana]
MNPLERAARGPRAALMAGALLSALWPQPSVGLDFSWSATADTLDWFGVDNPVTGNSGWILQPNFLTPQAPDGADDRAFISLAGKTVTLSQANTVGEVTLGAQQLSARLRLLIGGAVLTAVDAFTIGPGGELGFQGGTVVVGGGALDSQGLIHGVSNIGVIDASVLNRATGVVRVDNSATLQFAGPGTTVTNSGTLETVAGGLMTFADGVGLVLDGGTVDNQGAVEIGDGQVAFDAGDNTGNPLSLVGSTLSIAPTAGQGAFAFSGGVLVGDIAAGQLVSQQGSQPLVTPDSFSNAGELQLRGDTFVESTLTVMGGGEVHNTGTVRAVMAPPQGNQRRVNGRIVNQSQLIVDPGVTLTATAVANSAGVTVGAGGALDLASEGSNDGTMLFVAGSQMLVAANGAFHHTAGATTLHGEWQFGNNATLDHTGGTITGGGVVRFENARLNLAPGAGAMTFDFEGGTFSGDLESGQTLRHSGDFFQLTAPDSLLNEGVIELVGSRLADTRLVLQGGATLTNAGTLRVVPGGSNGLRSRVTGTIENQGALIVEPGVMLTTTGLVNTGSMELGAGAQLTVSGGVFTQQAGSIVNGGVTVVDSTVNYAGGDIVGSAVQVAGASSLNLDPAATGVASFIHGGANISGGVGANTSVTLQANVIGVRTIVSAGSFTNHGELRFDNSPGGEVNLRVDGLEFVNEQGGVVAGNGTITLAAPGGRYINRGVHSAGASAGQIDVAGDFENDATGVFAVEIGGPNAADYDVTIATGVATLAGTLEVSLINGFTPDPTDVFTLLAAGAISGEFDNAANGARVGLSGAAGSFVVEYDASTVRLVDYLSGAITSGLSGDYNNDGVVDAADYTRWRDNLGQPAGALPNDSDGGPIGPAQYATWRANYGAAVPTPVAASAPEPAALLLGAACGVLVVRLRFATDDGRRVMPRLLPVDGDRRSRQHLGFAR